MIFHEIEKVSVKYQVSEGLVDYIVRNESSYNNCALGDFHVPKPSYGLAQINLYYHPLVKPHEAYNPLYALEFLASNLKAGNCSWWTTCRAFKKKFPYAKM